MIQAFVGTKKSMNQWWDQAGKRWPVTVVAVDKAVVVGLRTQEKDGYTAVQLGFGTKKNLKKPQKKQMVKAGLENQPKFIKEIKTGDSDEYKVGDKLTIASVLEPGDVVAVRGKTKGRGFSGVMKRWGFSGGPRTHGQSDRARAPGSIGQGTDPGRVHKGKKMPGRYGNETRTITNLVVVKVDEEASEVWVSGPVPGAFNGKLTVSKLGRKSKMKFDEPSKKEEAKVPKKEEKDVSEEESKKDRKE